MPSEAKAKLEAIATTARHAGVVVWVRTADLALGDFGDPVILFSGWRHSGDGMTSDDAAQKISFSVPAWRGVDRPDASAGAAVRIAVKGFKRNRFPVR